MYKKRLEDALTAAKTIQAGFNLNECAKNNHIELLYRVNCISRFFEAEKLKIRETDEAENTSVLSLQFNQQANILAAGDSNGRVQLFDVFSGKALDEDNNKITQQTTIPALTVRWHPMLPNILYSANANGSIMMYDRDTKKQQLLVKENNETTCIDVNYRGKYLATAGADHRIRLYDLQRPEVQLASSYSCMTKDMDQKYKVDEKVAVQLDSKAHSNRIFAIKFHHDEPDIFYTGGWDRTVKIWDKRAPKGLVDTIYGPAICGDGIDLKGNTLLTASWLRENSLQLWDLRNIKDSKPLTTVPLKGAPDGEYLYSGKFCDTKNNDNKKIVCCGSGSKSVHLIDYEKAENISVLQTEAPLYCIDTIYSGCIFASGSTRNFFVGLSKQEKA